METRTDRAESRKTVDLVKQFIDAAFKYRFLYVQNRTDGAHRVDAVQRAALDSIQKAHTKAQTLLRSIEACGLPASESHDAWRLLSIGLPDASYADCERALKNWAKAAAEAGPGPAADPLKDDPMGRALLLIKNNPRLSNADIAKLAGVNPKTLNKKQWKPFRDLRDSMRQSGGIPMGSKTKDGDLEAWEDASE